MIVKEYVAVCDLCGESFPDWKADSVSLIKVSIKREGWKKINGQDVCDECVKKGKRPSKPKRFTYTLGDRQPRGDR